MNIIRPCFSECITDLSIKLAAECDSFLDDLGASLLSACSYGADAVIVMGDFNDRCTVWDDDHSHSELGDKLRNLSSAMGFNQLITIPTHINNEGKPDHILDLIFTNCPEKISNTNVYSPVLNCDHCFVNCEVRLSIPVTKGIKRNIWDFKNADFDGLNQALVCIPWIEILNNYRDVHDKVTAFTQLLFDTAKLYIPHNCVIVKPRDKPWINSKMKLLIRKRDRALLHTN